MRAKSSDPGRPVGGHLIPLVLGIGAITTGADSFAQGASRIVEEVVVTAQRREQSLQDVPIAVSAFSAQDLAEANINSVQAIGNLAPNVTLDAGSPFSGSSAVLTSFIRGIGQDDFAFNLDPGVGVYLDGVYLARTVGANLDLLDVERVEILKGPQGTLFGRNSIGGAISIVTREPGDTFNASGEVVLGRYNRMDVRGTVDVPIVADRLLSSLTFSKTSRDGYVTRQPFPGTGSVTADPLTAVPRAGFRTTDLEGGDDQWTVRGKLKWRGSGRFDAMLTADFQRVDQSGLASTLLDTFALEGVPGELFATAYNLCISVPTAALPTDPGGNIQALCGPLGTSGSSLAEVNIDADGSNDRLPFDDRFISPDIDSSYATGPSFSILESWGTAATLSWEFQPATLKSITAYRELDWDAAMDVDASPVVIVEPGFQMNQRQFSQELQLSGAAFDDRLDFVLGAYYFRESGNLHDLVPFAAGLLQIDGNNELQTSAWALFAHLNFALTDRIGLTFGGRYTEEDKEFEGFQRDPNGFLYKLVAGVQLADIDDGVRQAIGFPDPDDPLRFFPPGLQTKDFQNFSPRIGIEFTPADNSLIYLSYSEGYKTGGWTTRLSFPEQTAPEFEEEEATSWELGLKSELLNRRLRINAAAFFTEYDGIQLNQVQGISPTVRNAGNADIQGLEVELQAVITDRFYLAASAGVLDDDYTFRAPGVNAGDRLPKTARDKFTLSPRYTLDTARGALTFAADYTRSGSLFNNTENTELLKRDAVDLLNASISYAPGNGRYEFTAGASNLLDERYLTTGFLQTGGGIVFGTYNRPREWFAKLSVNLQ